MSEADRRARFEELVLVHMDAAYSLARWIVQDEAQAEEAVQEACLRAFRFFHAFRGGDALPWFLGIVRNVCYTLLARESGPRAAVAFDEEACDEDAVAPGAILAFPVNPEAAAIASADRAQVRRCLRALPREFREVLVLRELSGCSYRQIAAIVEIPIGTVMSRLARARRLLRRGLTEGVKKETGT